MGLPLRRGVLLLCPLTAAPEGVPLRVALLSGCGHFRRRLADLGVVPGARMTLVRRGSPVLLALGDARFGLGRGMAERIFVDLDEGEV